MLQSRRKPRNIDVMLHVVLVKSSNCGVADAVIIISFCTSSHFYLYSAFNNTNCVKATAQYQNRKIVSIM